MKKIVKLSLILLITMCIMSNVYAALNCNIDIKTDKTEYSKNEEFTVDINLTNVNSDKGIIAIGGTLEYDKESLTLVKMEGKNEWAKPSYNEANGKFVMDRGSVTTSDETAFQITFKVKEGSKRNLTISLKDISISDGNTTHKISLVEKSITIKDGVQNTNPTPNTNNTNTDTTNKTPSTNTNSNSVKNVSSNTVYKNGTLPKTGESNITLIIVGTIIMFVVIVVISIAKIKIINKKEIEK